MKNKDIKPIFVPYTENLDFRTIQDYNRWNSLARRHVERWWEDENDFSKWNIDAKYKEYSEWFLCTKLKKEEYKKIINKIIHLQKKGRITSKEGDYLRELWRALEPLHPFERLALIKKGHYGMNPKIKNKKGN